MTPYIAIVQQPACSNVILVKDGIKRRLFQHSHERCIGYAEAASIYEEVAREFLEVHNFSCEAGDATKQIWTTLDK